MIPNLSLFFLNKVSGVKRCRFCASLPFCMDKKQLKHSLIYLLFVFHKGEESHAGLEQIRTSN